jgi:hypothetical protein
MAGLHDVGAQLLVHGLELVDHGAGALVEGSGEVLPLGPQLHWLKWLRVRLKLQHLWQDALDNAMQGQGGEAVARRMGLVVAC